MTGRDKETEIDRVRKRDRDRYKKSYIARETNRQTEGRESA